MSTRNGNANAAALLAHLRTVVGVAVGLTPTGRVRIQPKARVTPEVRDTVTACLPGLVALLQAEAHAGDDATRDGDGESWEATPAYTFASAFPAGHFVADYVAYASARTDAALEFHEVGALVLLANATPRVRAHLAPYPSGLPTNLYTLLLADSTLSRKSTALGLARDLQERALPQSLLPDQFSPEAFVEQLAERPGASHTWFCDEFTSVLDRLHHTKYMTGLQGLLLTVYGGASYRYTRHTKRQRKTGVREVDEDLVTDPHLSILGAATPTLFECLTEADLLSGLLPRFAVVMPSAKPPRRPFYEVSAGTEVQRTTLVTWLHRLHEWALSRAPRVQIDAEALAQLDAFAASLEQAAATAPEAEKVMVARLTPMAVKVALLAAAGRREILDGHTLPVTAADATAALGVLARWQADARAFAQQIGSSRFERDLRRCVRVLQARRKVPRRVVAQVVHLDKKALDLVEATLVDRGCLTVHVDAVPGRPGRTTWEWTP